MTGERLSVRIASTADESRELLALRTTVYTAAGKHHQATTMQDAFDADAMHIGVWDGRVPIAAARVLCRDPDAEWEHDRFVRWDGHMPPRHLCCEVSRFCVAEGARRWAVIRLLCHGVLEAMLRSGRPQFVGCCTTELVPFYRRFFGVEFVGASFVHADLGPKPHHLFRCDFVPGLLGQGIPTLAWLTLWPTAVLASLGRLPAGGPAVSVSAHCRLWVARGIEPLAWRLLDLLRQGKRRARTLRLVGRPATGWPLVHPPGFDRPESQR